VESIKDKVAIVGMGCTKFGERWDAGLDDLAIEAAYEAYEDAGIDPADIQACWYGSVTQPVVGIGCTHLAGPLKLHGIPMTRVENWCTTGHEALRNACFGVACGMYDLALVLGAEKLKDTGFPGLGMGRGMSTVLEARRTAPGSFGMIATRYFYAHGLSPEEGKQIMGKIAVKNHYNGSLCPKAHFRNRITLEQVLNAPIIAWPLGLFDCCGNSDGAAAALLVPATQARKYRDDPIYVKGIGAAHASLLPQNRPAFDWLHFEEVISSSRQAYQQAGVTNPREQIDLAEVHDCFTSTELLLYELLGFSAEGQARDDVDSGYFELAGPLPVNSDGGLKCFGHPVGASGLRMTYEVYKQLQGRAELPERQIRNPRLGLSQTFGGPPQAAAVAVLGNEQGYP
jgi:acetyl-CoA C-acetyltransferase